MALMHWSAYICMSEIGLDAPSHITLILEALFSMMLLGKIEVACGCFEYFQRISSFIVLIPVL